MCEQEYVREARKIQEQQDYLKETKRIYRENAENLQKQTEFLERIAKSLEVIASTVNRKTNDETLGPEIGKELVGTIHKG